MPSEPKPEKTVPQPENHSAVNVPEKKPEKAAQPLLNTVTARPSRFSIQKKLEKQEKVEEEQNADSEQDLPSNHFTETDLQQEWQEFLAKIQQQDIVIFNAIQGFKVEKTDENVIKICYPSETAKAEFDKVAAIFVNAFKHKVNNFRIEILYQLNARSMKKELETKRSKFEKLAAKNPLLRELDDLFKFDFNS